MELSEAVSKFKADLDDVKKGGVSQLEIDNLVRYLDNLAANAGASLAERRMQHELYLAQYNATSAHQNAQFQAVMDAGKEAINAAIIINGGAVIALMAFMGNVASKPGNHYIALLAKPLLLFGIGTLLGGISFGGRYISQFLYANVSYSSEHKNKTLIVGHIVNGIVWLTTLFAFLAFSKAVIVCYWELSKL